MSEENSKKITKWLFITCGIIMVLVVFGGYVRLTRSGLSIVEWNPVTGVLPPIGEEAWQAEFAKYQQSPEFQKINKNMTLEGYKSIFYLEFIHRLIARFAGLTVVIPIFYWLFKGVIPWRKSAPYLWIGLLFGFQGYMGWYMVSSGLIDNPAVSHYRLAAHLLTALLLLGLALWTRLNHTHNFTKINRASIKASPFWLSLFLMLVLIVQITYGAFMAGLKAGHASSTFPLMYGKWLPPGLLSFVDPWWRNLIAAPPTVHYIHRWFAFAVLIVAGYLYWFTKQRNYGADVQKSALVMVWLVSIQILLGLSVIWFFVPTWLALVHQGTALFLFITAVYLNYQFSHLPVPEHDKAAQLKPTTA